MARKKDKWDLLEIVKEEVGLFPQNEIDEDTLIEVVEKLSSIYYEFEEEDYNFVLEYLKGKYQL